MKSGAGMTQNPNKGRDDLRAISTPIENTSTITRGTSRFSADLESGRRPELKSAEKRDVPLVIVEVFSIEVEIARRSSLPLLGF